MSKLTELRTRITSASGEYMSRLKIQQELESMIAAEAKERTIAPMHVEIEGRIEKSHKEIIDGKEVTVIDSFQMTGAAPVFNHSLPENMQPSPCEVISEGGPCQELCTNYSEAHCEDKNAPGYKCGVKQDPSDRQLIWHVRFKGDAADSVYGPFDSVEEALLFMKDKTPGNAK